MFHQCLHDEYYLKISTTYKKKHSRGRNVCDFHGVTCAANMSFQLKINYFSWFTYPSVWTVIFLPWNNHHIRKLGLENEDLLQNGFQDILTKLIFMLIWSIPKYVSSVTIFIPIEQRSPTSFFTGLFIMKWRSWTLCAWQNSRWQLTN